VHKHAQRLNRQIDKIPDEAMRTFTDWEWPGNVRELENFIERAVILSKGPILAPPLSELMVTGMSAKRGDSSLAVSDREHILRVLRETRGMIGGPDGAAARLGIKRTTLNSKLKKLEIAKSDYS